MLLYNDSQVTAHVNNIYVALLEVKVMQIQTDIELKSPSPQNRVYYSLNHYKKHFGCTILWYSGV